VFGPRQETSDLRQPDRSVNLLYKGCDTPGLQYPANLAGGGEAIHVSQQRGAQNAIDSAVLDRDCSGIAMDNQHVFFKPVRPNAIAGRFQAFIGYIDGNDPGSE